MNKDKVKLFLGLFFAGLAVFFFLSSDENKVGTPQEVLLANIGDGYESVGEVFDVIALNDEGDALCTFSTDEKLGVAYLNCVGENQYKYGTSVIFNHYFISPEKYDETSFFEAGDSDLKIQFVVCDERTYVNTAKEKYTYTVGDNTFALNIISVEEHNSSGYMYYIKPNED